MPPHTEASKATSTPCGRGRGEQIVAVVGQQGLVGGDHVLAPGDGAPSHSPGRRSVPPMSSTTMSISGSSRMSSARVVRRSAGRATGRGRVQVQVRHLLQDQGRPQAPGQQLPLLGEQAHHAAPHGAEADQADLNGFHVPLKILAPNTGAKVFTPVFRAQSLDQLASIR